MDETGVREGAGGAGETRGAGSGGSGDSAARRDGRRRRDRSPAPARVGRRDGDHPAASRGQTTQEPAEDIPAVVPAELGERAARDALPPAHHRHAGLVPRAPAEGQPATPGDTPPPADRSKVMHPPPAASRRNPAPHCSGRRHAGHSRACIHLHSHPDHNITNRHHYFALRSVSGAAC